MEKTFVIYGREYTVSRCKATACGDTETQEALKVHAVHECGEITEMFVFGYDMPETLEEFECMCGDATAWQAIYNY